MGRPETLLAAALTVTCCAGIRPLCGGNEGGAINYTQHVLSLIHLCAFSILLTHWFQNVSCYKLEHCLGSWDVSLQPDLGTNTHTHTPVKYTQPHCQRTKRLHLGDGEANFYSSSHLYL